jgi:hypothetical protein
MKRSIALLVVGGIALAIAGFFAATNTEADHGSDFIDLASAPFLEETHNGAIFTQGGIGAGTGNFDPFLTYLTNADTEQGYPSVKGTSGIPQFDEHYGGSRTHAIGAAAIPAVDIGGTLYRVILLDANDKGSEDFMSIDTFKVFLDDQPNLSEYNNAASSFGTDVAPLASLIYNMDDNCPGDDCVLLMRSQTFTPGSGVSDISVALPDSLFPEECYYGSQTCGLWFYLFNQMGGYADTGADPVTGTQNWNVTAGFEEWRTELLPVVNVEKTAAVSYTITYDWTLEKQVSIDGGATWVDAASVDLFVGDGQDYLWRLVATRLPGVVSEQVIAGEITITNPTGGAVIADDIPATITSIVDDIVFDDATPDIPGVTLTCGGAPYGPPYALGAGESLVCTYSVAVPGATQDTTGTNEVTVVVADAGTDFVATDTFDFGEANVTEIDETATLSDGEVIGPDQVLLDSGTFESSSNNYTCGEDTLIENTGSLTEDDSGQVRTASASLTIDCWELTVSKDANTSLTRTYDWTLVKQVSIDGGTTWVDAASVDLFVGDGQDYLWRLVATKGAGVDSDWLVQGTITINNPAPMAASGVSVSDALSTDGAAAVDCGGGATTVDVPAESSAQCTYSKSLPGANDQTNTATATLFSNDVTGSADVDFSTAVVTEIDETATLSDPEVPAADGQTVIADGFFTSGTLTYTCGETTTIVNTGDLTEDDSGQLRQDSAQITITCIPPDEGLTPGFWQGGDGLPLWDEPNDPQFTPAGGNPFYAGQLWEDQPVLSTDGCPGLSICDKTLLQIVGSGGGSDWVHKAARDAIAAVLNSAHANVNYAAGISEIQSDWAAALGVYLASSGTDTSGLEAFHAKYSAFNELGIIDFSS